MTTDGDGLLDGLTIVLRLADLPPGTPLAFTYGSADSDRWTAGDTHWNSVQRQWEFTANRVDPSRPLEFALRAGDIWKLTPNVVIDRGELVEGATIVVDERSIRFPPSAARVVENPLAAEAIFSPREAISEDLEFDLIVVGSGAGGGTLAYAAAGNDRNKRILVIESGSFLLPTHVQNLPRPQLSQPDDDTTKPIWQLFFDFARDVGNAAELPPGQQSFLRIAQFLGGQTLFWGALAPRPAGWELRSPPWPAGLVSQLQETYLDLATDLMRVSTSSAEPAATLQQHLTALPQLMTHVHEPAPLATEFTTGSNVVPAGTFSTADLLIERRLQLDPQGAPRFPGLDVLLNHSAVAVEGAVSEDDPSGWRASGVVVEDRVRGRRRRFRLSTEGQLVLAAGTLCTPLIADPSEAGASLPDHSGLRGRGLTDHPVWVVEFSLPADNPHCRPDQNAVLLSRPVSPAATPFNVKLVLNTWLAQSRQPASDREVPVSSDGVVPCQLVVLFDAGLVDRNIVRRGTDGGPEVDMLPASVDETSLAAARTYCDAVLSALGVNPVPPGKFAPLGGVSHQVGTMRMSVSEDAGVVDPDLRLWGTDNVYVCDLSVFPTSPASNPTLTLVALAIRLADKLTGLQR